MASILCLACSCSLPPKLSPPDVYRTACCARPICPQCLSSNPRLRRYNPCLACLGGVSAVRSQIGSSASPNVDASVRNEDVFVLGDEDSDEEEGTWNADPGSLPSRDNGSPGGPRTHDSLYILPPYPSSVEPTIDRPSESPPIPERRGSTDAGDSIDPPSSGSHAGGVYHIQPDDTLRGLALRLRIDGRTLCRLNNLPPSTLTTTPHVLHTRTTLILPESAENGIALLNAKEQGIEARRKGRRERERAEKRLRTLTKEVDWRVAKVYVALADLDHNGQADHDMKRKEACLPRMKNPLEEMALDLYLDDAEWEEQERRAARIPGSGSRLGPNANLKERRWGLW